VRAASVIAGAAGRIHDVRIKLPRCIDHRLCEECSARRTIARYNVSKGHKRGQRSPVVGKEIPRKLDARECRGNEASYCIDEKSKPPASMEHRRASYVPASGGFT